MKTTIDIANGLFEQGKAVAAREGTSFRALVEEGLRLALQRRAGQTPPYSLADHSVHGEGLAPGLSWALPRELAYDDVER
jgi:hypothetical protein